VWSYNAFPLLLIVVITYIIAAAVLEKRFYWQPLAYAAVGVGLGLLINPYFPENLLFIYRHISPKLGDPTATSVGSEWYPYNTSQLMENSGLSFVALLIGVTALGLANRRMRTNTATSLFLVFIFGYMLFQSRRFIEYAPPFVLVFAAFAAAPLLQNWLNKNELINTSIGNLRGWIPAKSIAALSRSFRLGWVLAGLMMVVLIPALFLNLSASRKSFESSAKPYTLYAGASAWLEENTPPGSRVFQTDWDDFPRLFFYNTHNTYTLGLDPTYMQLYEAGLYDRWVDITKGRVDSPSTPIWDEFGAAYVISDLRHKNFLTKAEEDPDLVEVYRDEDSVVLQVLGAEIAD
jgi:intracellular septation protein A